jgi:proteasome lid subunit RPN8/RPN11
MIAHAEAGYPLEACGLLVGDHLGIRRGGELEHLVHPPHGIP